MCVIFWEYLQFARVFKFALHNWTFGTVLKTCKHFRVYFCPVNAKAISNRVHLYMKIHNIMSHISLLVFWHAPKYIHSLSRWPCRLRRNSAVAFDCCGRGFDSRWEHGFSSLLYIVYCESRGLRDNLITFSEESYSVVCMCECVHNWV